MLLRATDRVARVAHLEARVVPGGPEPGHDGLDVAQGAEALLGLGVAEAAAEHEHAEAPSSPV